MIQLIKGNALRFRRRGVWWKRVGDATRFFNGCGCPLWNGYFECVALSADLHECIEHSIRQGLSIPRKREVGAWLTGRSLVLIDPKLYSEQEAQRIAQSEGASLLHDGAH